MSILPIIMELEAWGAPSSVWGSDDGGRISESSYSQTSLWLKEGLVDWVSCSWESWDSLMPLPFLLTFLAMPTYY